MMGQVHGSALRRRGILSLMFRSATKHIGLGRPRPVELATLLASLSLASSGRAAHGNAGGGQDITEGNMRTSLNRRHFMASTAAASLSTLAIGAAPPQPPGSQAARRRRQRQRPARRREGDGADQAGARPARRGDRGRGDRRGRPQRSLRRLGGLPNEDGVVELDAAVMHGPTHGGGSVASIRNIMHPAAVARLVMKRTATACSSARARCGSPAPTASPRSTC